MRKALIVCSAAVGLWVLAGERAADAAPPNWTCPASYYTDNYCDCGCGYYDPACDNASATLWDNCAGSYDCTTATTDPAGDFTCGGSGGLGVPSGWTCNDSYYDADDGCDCGCGEVDPDCSDAGAALYGCGGGQVCNPSGACQSASAHIDPNASAAFLQFGGMCSKHFIETASSKLNSTSYRVRNANTSVTEVDAYVNMSVSGIEHTYNEIAYYLDKYCGPNKTCYILNYSAGDNSVHYALDAEPNPDARWPGIVWIVTNSGAGGGSDLASWGSLADLFTCAMASTLTKSNQRNLYDHNVAGNIGLTVFRHGGEGHSAWKPWDWSSTALWAATGFIGGEDDGAVGIESAGGCTSSAARNDMNCSKFAGYVCDESCTNPKGLDHYEMKMRGQVFNDW